MAISDGQIDIDAVGDHFRLRRTEPSSGKIEEILLSDSDIIQTSISALNLQGMVLRRRANASTDDIVLMPVDQGGSRINPAKGNVNLKMIDPGGFSTAFALLLKLVKKMEAALEKRVAELEEKMKTS